MATLLRVVGILWLMLGVFNIFVTPWANAGETLLSLGLLFNALVFVFPGLILTGIGEAIARRSSGEDRTVESGTGTAQPVEERLRHLDHLLSNGTITQQEHSLQRASILKDL